jgi:hypothetical protein
MKCMLWMPLLLILALALPTFAAPSLGVPSGYIFLPNAQIAPRDVWDTGLAYLHTAGDNQLGALIDPSALPCDGDGATLRGITGLSQTVEVGAGLQYINKEYGSALACILSAKAQVWEDAAQGMSAAAGLLYRDWSTDMTGEILGGDLDLELPSIFSAYLAIDKSWSTADGEADGRATLGVMWDRFGATRQVSTSGLVVFPISWPFDPDGSVDSKAALTPFFGIQLRQGDLTFLGEYKPGIDTGGFNYADDLWSLAVRKQVNPDLAVTGGLTSYNLPYADADLGFYLDAAWVF